MQTKMDKSVKMTLIIVSAIVVVGALGFIAFYSLLPVNVVTGNGVAEIEVMPDIVGVYFNVETTGDSISEASSENSKIVDQLMVNLLKLGFERKEIQTMNFQVYTDYDWKNGERIEKGQKAVHTLKVEMDVEQTNMIGDVIDAGIDAEAGISYINFELSQEKQNKYKAEALKLASEDARIKAESVAEGLGKRLGRLFKVETSDFNYYPWRTFEAAEGVATMDAAEVKSATTNIAPSEQTVSASVTATFKIF